jgi:hypothetical protein
MPRHERVDEIRDGGVGAAREERSPGVENRARVTGDSRGAIERGQVAALVDVEAVAVGTDENEPPTRGQPFPTPGAAEPASERLGRIRN